MGAFVDLTGQQIGRWTVLGRDKSQRFPKPRWKCRCECGHLATVRGSDLRSGQSQQCVKCRPSKHGGAGTPEYRSWLSMKARCCDPNATHYARYGGRGICICERWLDSFKAFLADMGPRPEGKCLERLNNDLGYSPENCCWASRKDQARNRSDNRLFTHDGETRCLAEWCEVLGLSAELIRSRIKMGWSFEEAIVTKALPQTSERGRGLNGRFVSRRK